MQDTPNAQLEVVHLEDNDVNPTPATPNQSPQLEGLLPSPQKNNQIDKKLEFTILVKSDLFM